MPDPADPPADADLSLLALREQPGHLVRRAQQIVVSMFLEAVEGAVTPLQYAILCTLQDHPGIDQVTLAQDIALDNSTTADTAARLEAKGLIVRELMPRRQRRLVLTAAGERLLRDLEPVILRMRADVLAGLEPDEQQAFMRLLRKFVDVNHGHSRAPRRSRGPA